MKKIMVILATMFMVSSVWAEKINIQIVYDCSGSMGATVDGKKKSDIAKEAFRSIYVMVNRFQSENPNTEVNLGIISFKGTPLPLQKFVKSNVIRALGHLPEPGGNTPLGDALKTAYAGFPSDNSKCHIFVLTDGEENGNLKMVEVITGEKLISKLYFVAFDVNANVFKDVKNLGAMVVQANNASELSAQVSTIFTQNILLEKEE